MSIATSPSKIESPAFKLAIGQLDEIARDVEKKASRYRMRMMVCGGTGCITTGGLKFKRAMEEELVKRGLQDQVQILVTGCNGFCARGPIAVVYPDGIFYNQIKPEDAAAVVEEHVLGGRPVESLLFQEQGKKNKTPLLDDIGFFNSQKLIALTNRGLIDAESIDEYIAKDGYRALAKALTEMTPVEIIEEIKISGLRGRGGAGFPAGRKWEICAKAPGSVKYVVCNADEGDPGAYMDRSIIEADPHSVLEGMMICGRAIGACEGFIYIREEYPLARERLATALIKARKYGLLGEKIFGADFNFDIFIKQGAGAFVCGEGTALMRSIEGVPPEPRQRPPYNAQSGLWGKPTNLNNVETLAAVPWIIRNGGKELAKLGTEKSKGTKVFSLVGKIRNTGLVEIEMGTPLRRIIYEIGGGIPDDKAFKAVQTGGPSGGCIPASLLDLPVDYEHLAEAGSIMGSGGMVVMDEDTCMVDVARYFLEFTTDESCGRCSSCRDGSAALLELLTDMCNGRSKEGDIELLEEICHAVTEASLCGLGESLPNPVLSTLRYFRNEYKCHVFKKKCPAHSCKALIRYFIDPEACKGCGVCARNCPAKAITGERKSPHKIDPGKCTKCGICREGCKVFGIDAVRVE